MKGYKIKYRKDHVEVYLHGSFCFSADTEEEARREIKKQEEKRVPWTVLVE